ncbi:MAG TPA: SRPBCC family protein [Solirubrobacteraceae bacterium]|nr:SRPBCC family protein [Solirubrobacteraceae bacterium]
MRIDGSATLEVQASPAACRDALLDLASYPTWYPGVTTAELVDAPGRGPTARLVFTTGMPIISEIECVLEILTPTAERVQAVTLSDGLRIDGDGWTLAGPPDGPTTVTYAIGVEMSVPGGIFVEHLVKARAGEFLIDRPVAALKGHVERPPDPGPR